MIRDALEARLRMIIPFIEQWPQAMALMVVPSNTKEHFSNLSQLMDDIWYHAGDRSVDVSIDGVTCHLRGKLIIRIRIIILGFCIVLYTHTQGISKCF